MSTPPLDVLLYAHDGRGLGHVSRTVAIGLALRRRHPGLRVLLTCGARQTGELVGGGGLDWLKLPGYATQVVDGVSRGASGPSGYADAELGRLRAMLIARAVETLRPRVVLADHTPQGKHRELVPAIESAQGLAATWVLGVRAVAGEVPQQRSELARTLFRKRYAALLWYGDDALLGGEEPRRLEAHLGMRPEIVGYVSRLAELEQAGLMRRPRERALTGTVAVPWLGEHTSDALRHVAGALQALGERGRWDVFVEGAAERAELAAVEGCRVRAPGPGYLEALLGSRVVLVYGGYNTLTDVLHAGVPAVVIVRGMADGEQRAHVDALAARLGGHIAAVSEAELEPEALARLLEAHLTREALRRPDIRLEGAARAADYLAALVARPEGALRP